MATKKTAAEQGLQQKVKVLTKLFDAGCKTEKDLKALTLPDDSENPRCDRAGYDGHHRASGAGRKESSFLILGRWNR